MISITTSNVTGNWRDVDSLDVHGPATQSQELDMRIMPELTRRPKRTASLRE